MLMAARLIGQALGLANKGGYAHLRNFEILEVFISCDHEVSGPVLVLHIIVAAPAGITR